MFRKLLLVFTLLLLLSFTASGYALESANVKDGLNYLTESEISELQTKMETLRDTYGLDPVIVITDDTEGKTSMAYADDYFDYNGYGVGDDHSGLLMLINMSEREVWISTTGRAIDLFTDDRIAAMVDRQISHLKDGQYASACQAFLSDVESYALQGVPSGQYRTSDEPVQRGTYGDRVKGMLRNPIPYGIALVAALGLTILLTVLDRGRVTVNAQTYEEMGSFVLSRQQDDYLLEITTKTKIEKHSSSTHTGSSGRSHGGGGGHF